jgi:glycosyltransferase involved in cell wall biosynthesis
MSTLGNNKKISIIVPLFNEEENVVLFYKKVKDSVVKLPLLYEIIFIDDGSTDSTYQLLKGLRNSGEKIMIIKLVENFGQSAAFAAGFERASGDFAVTIDGDLQCNPQDISLLLRVLQQGADVVCSHRHTRNLRLLLKRTPSIIANFFGVFIFNLKVHDFSCSFRGYSKAFYKNVFLADGFHRFIPVLAKFGGMSIKEVSISWKEREEGSSKYNSSRFPKVIKDAMLLKITELFFNKSLSRLFKKANFKIEEVFC